LTPVCSSLPHEEQASLERATTPLFRVTGIVIKTIALPFSS
jgi:hypothetical protein